MRALIILFLLLLVQSGLLAFVLMLAGGGVGDLEPGYVTLSGTIRAERAGRSSPAKPTGINSDRPPSAPPSR